MPVLVFMLLKRVLLTAVVFVSAVPASLASPISIEARGATVSAICAKLTEATEQEHEVLKVLGGEVLYLDAKNLEPEEIRAHIARVLLAQWQKTKNGWRLTPDPVAVRDAKTAELEVDVRVINEVFDEKRKALDVPLSEGDMHVLEELQAAYATGKSPFNNWSAAIKRLQSILPGTRAAMLCAATLDPMEFAKMEPWTRRVFSLNPTRMQSPLPSAAKKVLESATAEFDYLSRFTFTNDLLNTSAFSLDGRYLVIPNQLLSKDRAVDLELSVYRASHGVNFEIEVKGISASGNVVFAGNGTIFGSRPRVKRPKIAPEIEQESLTMTQRSRKAAAAFTTQTGFGGEIEVSSLVNNRVIAVPVITPNSSPLEAADALLRKELSKPAEIDPLSYQVSESLDLMEARTKGAVIAFLPDGLTQLIEPPADQEFKRETLFKAWTDAQMVRKEADGWVVWSPSRPASYLGYRIDRPSLQNTIARSVNSKSWSLDVLAEHFASRPRAARSDFDLCLLTALSPIVSSVEYKTDPPADALRLWGALSATQRSTLTRGGEIPFGVLSTEQKSILSDLIFNTPVGLSKESELSGIGPGTNFSTKFQQEGYVPERTRLLGNGVPSNGILRARGEEVDGAIVHYKNGAVRAADAELLFAVQDESSRLSEYLDFTPSPIEGYVACRIQDIQLLCLPLSGFGVAGELRGISETKPGPPGPFASMNSALINRVREIAASERVRREKLGGPATGGSKPIP